MGAARYAASHPRQHRPVTVPRRSRRPRQDRPASTCRASAESTRRPTSPSASASTSGEKVVARVNHYFTDDEPLQIGITYIPWSIAGGTVLASQGQDRHAAASTNAWPSSATPSPGSGKRSPPGCPRPDETATLAIPPGVPVIELLHTGIDQDGQPFEVTRFVMRADRSGLDYHIPIEEPE